MATLGDSGDRILDDADKTGVVAGLKHVGPVVERQDIDVLLQKEPKTFNLFLLALAELQNDPDWDTHLLSYWQVAGIHGLPNFVFWNGIGGKQDVGDQDKNPNGSGYCEHSTLKFPTWHRPYLAMLEQTLYRKMLEIAHRYTDSNVKNEYVEAVKKFRLPYYDYHRPRNYNAKFSGIVDKDRTTSFPYDFGVPQVLTLQNVQVLKDPDNKPTSLSNPLLSFSFPEKKGDKESLTTKDWDISGVKATGDAIKKTLRWRADEYPNSLDRLNQAINEYREDAIRISLVLIEDGAYNAYKDMATGKTTSQNPLDGRHVTGSLEGMHNNYHNYIGGDPFKDLQFGAGHMTSVPVAAFDPIFWFHHCNIDRIFAVWQAAHDDGADNWFEDQDVAKEGLLPFITEPLEAGKDATFWSSNDSQETTSFGYTYPDIKGIEHGHSQQVRSDWKTQYEWARRLQAQKPGEVWKAPPVDFEPLDLSTCPAFVKPDGQHVDGFVPLRPRPSLKIAAPSAKLHKMAVSSIQNFDLAPGFSSAPSADIDEENVSREWYVDMAVKKLTLNNGFSVMYFIGQRDLSGDSYMLDPTFAGLSHVFTAPKEACITCAEQSEENVKVTATAPITSMLLDYVITGALPSMKAEHVEPFLIKHLKWIVVEVDGTKHDTREIARRGDFELNVTCKVAPLPGNEGTVVYEAYPQIIAQIIRNSS